MKSERKELIIKIVCALLSIAMLVLSCIYLRAFPKYILLGSIILFSSLGVIITNISFGKFESFFKVMLVALVICSVVLVAYIIMDETGLTERMQDPDALIEMIRGTKHWGVLVFIIFIVIEIIFLPIPGALTAFIGSALYGPTFGFIYITVGTIIGSILCFMLGKVFGKKLIIWMVGEQKTKKYADMLNEKGKFVFIIMMLFPFFPDDILCLVAGITSMSYKYFITVICLTRPIMIAFMCYFVEGSIIPFSGWGVPVWIAIIAIALVVFMLLGKLKNVLFDAKQKTESAQASFKKSDKE